MRTSEILLFVVSPLVLVLSFLLHFVFRAGPTLAFAASFVLSTAILLLLMRTVEVEAYERLIVRRGGTYIDTSMAGGRAFLIKGLESAIRVDMRPQTESAENEVCFTQDGINVRFSYLLLWQVVDPIRFKTKAPASPGAAVKGLASAALRKQVSAIRLRDVLGQRASLEGSVREDLIRPNHTKSWGVDLVTFTIQNIELPPEIVDIQKEFLRAAARRELGVTETNALEDMRRIVGDDARLLEILTTMSETLKSSRK